ncbi:MAG: long-chain fatty acid--CoA ligase, partial [Alphaproteobacteria bacterium]|nr:long-chain fatty acid--CoA ligase [Alphaproteobacteria bacterium]
LSYLHVLLILAIDRIGVRSMARCLPRATLRSPSERQQFRLTTILSAAVAPPEPPCRWVQLAERDRPRLGAADPARLAALDLPDDTLVRVIWSSGTTGGVKGVPITRACQDHRVVTRRLARGLSCETRYLASVPFASPSGYVMALAVLAGGGAVLLPRPGLDFVDLANVLGATTTNVTPSMLAELVAEQATRPRRLETMDVLMVSGTHLPPDVARAALAGSTPNIWVGYGATEVDVVSQGWAGIALDDPSAVGIVQPWVDAEIVDGADRPLPPGREGMLRLRSVHMIDGYFGDDAATRRNFRGGWFYPGDLGVITEDRLLRITGRVEDMIVRGSVALAPDALEDALRGLPGVRDVGVFALARDDGSQEICAAFVLGGSPVDAAQLLAWGREKLGDGAPTRLFKLATLPRNANGKLLRRELATLARQRLS